MKKFSTITSLLGCAALLLHGCGDASEIPTAQAGLTEVSFTADMGLSRTAVGDDMLSAVWTPGDKISLWADRTDGGRTLSAESFTFSGNESAASASFSALMPAMAAGTYTYYATYPEALSCDGNTAVLEIATTQDGTYGKSDILLAAPATDKSLSQRSSNLSLGFSHALHAFRISIPEGCNGLNERIKQIDFTFPAPVSGNAGFDITRPDEPAVLDNGNTTVSLIPDAGTDAGEAPLWIFFAPCDASQGTVQVKVRTRFDICTLTLPGRDFKPGHVTPVSLDIPQSATERTIIQLDLAENRLGQIPQSITITADDPTVNLGNGSSSLTLETPGFATDGCQQFALAADADDISSMELNITYTSEDAVVHDRITMPVIRAGETNRVECRVPYLMSQYFDDLAEYTDEATTGSKDLGSVGLPGWSASRSNGKAAGHISLRPFYAWIAGRYQGRLDSAPIGDAIKAGHSVDIVVEFTAGAGSVATPLQVGTTETTGTISSETAITNVCATFTLPKGSSSSPSAYKFEVRGAGPATRLSWRTNITSGTWTTYSDTPIDNIRVYIK